MSSHAPLPSPDTTNIVLRLAAILGVVTRLFWFVPRCLGCVCGKMYDLVVAGRRGEDFIHVSSGTGRKWAFKHRGLVARLAVL